MSSPSDNSRFCPVCGTVYAADTEFCPKDGSKVEQSEKIIAGRFILKEALGLGNMGAVHRAVQLPMGRQVAVKLLHPALARNPEMVARFEREALAASTVDHPNAVTIYDSGRTADGHVYIAMEYLEGESLAALLRREQPLSPTRAIELWIPAVKAMIVAHRKGIVHRDLKPDNVFISQKANEEGATEEVVKVLDFGIAKVLQGVPGQSGARANMRTLVGTRLGTALYMAPEQLEGRDAGKYSDVYALGLILMEMITGKLPWGQSSEEANAVTTMMRLVTPPKPLAELRPGQTFSPALQMLFDDILAVDPKRRPQDAGELIKRVAQVPEAQFLALSTGRRSDISQMFTSAFVSAALRSGAEAETGAASNSAASAGAVPTVADARSEKSGRVAAGRPAGLTPETPPQALPASLLPPAPTELLIKPGSTEAGANEQQASEPTPTPTPTLVDVKDAKSASPAVPHLENDTAKTLPQPVAAPPITLPAAATVPMAVAQRPPGFGSALPHSESVPTLVPDLHSGGKKEPLRQSTRRLGLLLSGPFLLLATLYFLWHSGYMRQLLHLPSPTQAPIQAASVQSTSAKPPTPLSAAEHKPSPAADLSDASAGKRRHGADSDSGKSKEGQLQITFRMRKPLHGSLVCDDEASVDCARTCIGTLSPGGQCMVRSPGYTSKQYKYEELERRRRRGRTRVDVSLLASP